ncbi:MAG: dihydrodipicolinate synthase family protein [Desulfobacterales bacterium]|jgi:4-hydroxy-2-oxoglutarate aldolase
MGHIENLSGVFPPVATPFKDEQVALEQLAENIIKYNTTDLKGYMILGSNGEFRSVTDDEALKIADVVARNKKPDKILIAGAARESTYATIEFIEKLSDLGVDYVAILAPHYFVGKMTDEALIRHYTSVADQSKIPITVYNAPKFSAGLLISPQVIAALADHPNIVGLKDTSKEDIAQYVNAVPKNAEFAVLAGTINKFYEGLLKGAVGGVLSLADYLPQKCCELQQAFLAGDQAKASQMDEYLRALSSRAAGKYGVAGLKAAMDLLGYYGGPPRLPLVSIADSDKGQLEAVLKNEGLL